MKPFSIFTFLLMALVLVGKPLKSQTLDPKGIVSKEALLYLEVRDAKILPQAAETYFLNFYGDSYLDKKLLPLNIPLISNFEHLGTPEESHWLERAFSDSDSSTHLDGVQAAIQNLAEEGLSPEERVLDASSKISELFSGQLFVAVEPSSTSSFDVVFGFHFPPDGFDWGEHLASIADRDYGATQKELSYLKNEGIYYFVRDGFVIGGSSEARIHRLLELLEDERSLGSNGLVNSRYYQRSMKELGDENSDIICFARPDSLLEIVKGMGVENSNHRDNLDSFEAWSSGFGLSLNFSDERTFDYTIRMPLIEPVPEFLVELDKHLLDLEPTHTRIAPKASSWTSIFKPCLNKSYENQSLLFIPGYRLDIPKWKRSFQFKGKTFVSNTFFHRSANLLGSTVAPFEITRFGFVRQENPSKYFDGYQLTDSIYGQILRLDDSEFTFERIVEKATQAVAARQQQSRDVKTASEEDAHQPEWTKAKSQLDVQGAHIRIDKSKILTAFEFEYGLVFVNRQGGTQLTDKAIEKGEFDIDTNSFKFKLSELPCLNGLPKDGNKVIYLRKNFTSNEIYWERIRPISIFVAQSSRRNKCSPDYEAAGRGDYFYTRKNNLCFDEGTSLISRLSLPLLTLLDRDLAPKKNLRLVKLGNSDFSWVEVLNFELAKKSIQYRGGITKSTK